MKHFTYTGSLFAVALAAYGGAAYGQGTCQQEIEQLRSQAQEQQLDSQLRQSIEALLSSAQNASDQECQQIVSNAQEQLESSQGQPQQVAQADSQQSAASQQSPAGQQSTSQESASQQPGQQSASQQSQSSQQSAGQQQSRAQSEEQTNVRIQQPPADVDVNTEATQVTVQQRQPTVTVDQPAPEVTITQPEPQVTVNQPEPEVTVEQAQPEVDVQTSEPEVQVNQAEPEVRVNQADEADVQVRTPGDTSQESASSEREQSSAVAGDSSRQTQTESQSGSISETAAAELVGKTVKTRDGEDIGDISGIARSRTDQQLYALVDVGGFLGIGERTVTIPLEQAQTDEEGNILTQMSRQEVEQMDEYDEEQYATLEEQGDQRLLR